MIVGTVQNAVKMAMMDAKWQQKKSNPGLLKKDMTAEERQINIFREQAEDMREGRIYAAIDAKIKAGKTLTPDEIAYLKKNSPAALKIYEEAREERKAYERELRNCKTKEEVEELKIQKMGSFLSQVGQISSNPHIPDGQKAAILGKILAQVNNISIAHHEFTNSSAYASLPTEEEMLEKESLENEAESVVSVTSDDMLMETLDREEIVSEETEDVTGNTTSESVENITGKTASNEVADTQGVKVDTTVLNQDVVTSFEQVAAEVEHCLKELEFNRKKVDICI